MLSVDLSQPSTWRGVAMLLAGAIATWLIAPEIAAIRVAIDLEQVQFASTKALALGTACSALGQIASGLIGVLFSDKGS